MRSTAAWAVSVLLASCSTGSLPDWEAPPGYSFTLTSPCGVQRFFGPLPITVSGDIVLSAEPAENDRNWPLPLYAPTVEELIDLARQAESSASATVEVDIENGTPTRIRIADETTDGDDFCFDITDYVRGDIDLDLRDIYRQAIQSACSLRQYGCTPDTRVSEAFIVEAQWTKTPLPDTVRTVVTTVFPEATFIDPNEPIAGDIILLGPIIYETANVVSVEAGVVCAGFCGVGGRWYFRHDGTSWSTIDPAEIGRQPERWDA